MKVLAISRKGEEFIYRPSSAHKVSARSAQTIADALNKIHFRITDNEVWFVHDVDTYDTAYYVAEDQSFKVYKGSIREYTH